MQNTKISIETIITHHEGCTKAYENWPFSKKLFLKFRLWGQMIDNLVLNSEQFFFLLQISWIFQRYVFKFQKIKGGTLWWKKSEKNWFLCLIPQKNRLEKCRMAVKSVFGYIDFWGSYGLKSTKKYFQKPISLPIYIF